MDGAMLMNDFVFDMLNTVQVKENVFYFQSQRRVQNDAIQDQYTQVNFVLCQLFALGFSFVFRYAFKPDKTQPATRHVCELVVGTLLAIVCFGPQIAHLLIQSVVSYLIISLTSPRIASKLVLVFAMAYLSVNHMYRQHFDYGGYVLDITGPLMINTQRVTSIAFGLKDGASDVPKSADPMIKNQQIKKVPRFLEYMSYMLCFHTLLCGPFIFFNDYKYFIEGKARVVVEKGGVVKPQTLIIIRKLAEALVAGIIVLLVLPMWQASVLSEASFYQQDFLRTMFFILIFTTVTRQKYYFAWKFAEAINVNAGIGFNGYDKNGKQKWDIVENARILNVELSTSFKELLDNWNITTSYWLRYVAYLRVKNMGLVFGLSALWHGFYPGYYFTFITGALYTLAARLFRRNVREFFQGNAGTKQLYDTFTFIATRIALAYMSFPFIILQFAPSILVYNSLYWFGHIIAVSIVVTLSIAELNKRPPPREHTHTHWQHRNEPSAHDKSLNDSSSTSSLSQGSSVDNGHARRVKDTESNTSFVF